MILGKWQVDWVERGVIIGALRNSLRVLVKHIAQIANDEPWVHDFDEDLNVDLKDILK